MELTLVNHACVKIGLGPVSVLCDPWLEGPAFNESWDLLVPTPLALDEVMAGVTHLWVSHEHPDHFAPGFFAAAADRWSHIPVLHRTTPGRRVAAFIESKGFEVIELGDRETVEVGDVRMTCGASLVFDSWLHLTDGADSVLNLNDCADEREWPELRRELGPIDLLLTQFSYAAWKGGRGQPGFRAEAAQQKLEAIGAQVRTLGARRVVPFASLMWFSHEENAFLNDHVNRPDDAARAITAAGAEPVVLFPGETWEVGADHDNGAALAAFDEVYRSVEDRTPRTSGASVSLEELERDFDAYRDRIFEQNSGWLIRLLRRAPLVAAFHPVAIRLTDLDRTVRVSVVDGFVPCSAEEAEVEMHSSSLAFVFRYPYGYDTLAVGGRFDATPEAFARMTKSLSVGSMNNFGMIVSPRMLLDHGGLAWSLRRLASVTRARRPKVGAGAAA
jgi:UDP-MurNAc hydroxylase